MLLAESGDFAAGEARMARALELRPNDPALLAAQGQLYAAWANVDPARLADAESAYRRAVAAAPTVPAYHAQLGWLLAKQGQAHEAALYLERAIDLDATDGQAFAWLADVYRALGRAADAEWAQAHADRWSQAADGGGTTP
jgi:predicted Zn-dependent protease